MKAIEKSPFGEVDGQPVELYRLDNGQGVVMRAVTYGAIVVSLEVPDRVGRAADVVLGFDDLRGYLAGHPYFGATVGRVGNRIRDARFELDGVVYPLAANDPPHHLHGGRRGWDKVVWGAEAYDGPEGPTLRLTCVSPDGDEGYPGGVSAACLYTLTKKNELRIEMSATCDAVTPLNMVHHTYWNLAGEGAGPITDHELTLHARQYTPGDPMVPTGEVADVAGTPFDFRTPKRVGQDLGVLAAGAVAGAPTGYDHNFVVEKGDGDGGGQGTLRPVARLRDPASGRVLTLEADQPGVQVYSGNFLDGSLVGKGGRRYQRHAAICLETQAFPNAINVPAWRDQVIARPGATYRHVMIHRFTAE